MAIALLSAMIMAGGIAFITDAGIHYQELRSNEGASYLPSAEIGWAASALNPTSTPVVVRPHYFLGTLSFPSIKKMVNIFEGTDSTSLAKGAGHYIQSVMPGIANNSVIAGHRDTVFSNLGKVKIGDPVVITVQTGRFTYVVTRIRIVDKNDRTVIVPTSGATLTLSTCYPFKFFGNAPKRYIVIAVLEGDPQNSVSPNTL